jgi:hypothetical protein
MSDLPSKPAFHQAEDLELAAIVVGMQPRPRPNSTASIR